MNASKRIQELLGRENKENADSNNAIIYTRVSTSKQVDNTSLEFQLQQCRSFCSKRGFVIVGEFGKTYESAKSDGDRKEFNRMLAFASKKEKKVKYLIIYSLDRFSRSGGSAISLITDLALRGIVVQSVTQPFDSKTSAGELSSGMMLLFSHFENRQREKVIAGMREKLKQGYTIFKAPVGYSTSSNPGIPEPNSTASLIIHAFELKLKNYSHDYIVQQLHLQGLAVNIKRLTDIFRNPYYCGFITHKLLNNDFVPGKHKALITPEIFEAINSKKVSYVSSKQDSTYELPLKGFVICSKCGTKWTGYRNKRKGINYYKCNHPGCKSNRNSDKMHTEFQALLQGFQLPHVFVELLKQQLRFTFEEMNKENINRKRLLEAEERLLTDRIKTVHTKFAVGELTEEVHRSAIDILKEELKCISDQLAQSTKYLSNLSEFVDYGVELSRNLAECWKNSPSSVRNRLQSLIFPEGITYDRTTCSYRTLEVNRIFAIMGSLSQCYSHVSAGEMVIKPAKEPLVVPTRIELVSRV